MWWNTIAWLVIFQVATASGWRSNEDLARFRPDRRRPPPVVNPESVFKRQSASRYLNNKTSPFAVDGTKIPDVDFYVGESYAGQLPISNKTDEQSKLYFWFFPTVSTNASAEKEIIIWLNGGPGCSSLEGILQENGPFLWQYGTYKPVANHWSWHQLANVVWVDQPIGSGFSTGVVTATNEDDVAEQFIGFWRNFIDLFDMQGYKIYLTGESYAGMYCPYIGKHFLDANDTDYLNLQGMLIYDPSIGNDDVQSNIPAVAFMDYHRNLHPFNDSFTEYIHTTADQCGWTDFLDTYLVYPPKGPQPSQLPDRTTDARLLPECSALVNNLYYAALLINPCWDIYQVATTCPLLWDVLGFPGTLTYTPAGADIYFNRTDVKKAINAPLDVTWLECSNGNVFAGRDTSQPPIFDALPRVIDGTQNVIIGHGALDFVLLLNGTLLSIQNMTWGGQLGFQSKPVEPFYVPYNTDNDLSTLAGAGVFGTAHTERGLTYVGVDLSGHMIPQYQPSSSFRHLEFLLGRVDSLQSTAPFTIDTGAPQSTQDLGNGTAPQGWSDA